MFPAPGDTAAQKGLSVHPPSPSSVLLGHFENSLRLFEALLFKFSEKVLYRNQGKLTRGQVLIRNKRLSRRNQKTRAETSEGMVMVSTFF